MKTPAKLGQKIIVVGGTNTGVGKTVASVLLVQHLRTMGLQAWAVKPVSTGDRQDAQLLQTAIDEELTLEEINPYHFQHPVAPLLAARMENRKVRFGPVLRHLRDLASRCDCLVVEGAGGWWTPLGENWDLETLSWELRAHRILVAADQLGVVHQVRCAFQSMGRKNRYLSGVILSEAGEKDVTKGTNESLLCEFLPGIPVVTLKKTSISGRKIRGFVREPKKIKKTLARLMGADRFVSLFGTGC